MESCANCNCEFKERPKKRGYYRFSIEIKLPNSKKTARDALSLITGGAHLTPATKREGRFLCPPCWSSLNTTAKYKESVEEFWGRSSTSSYLGSKRKLTDSPTDASSAKRPLFTSTPKSALKAGSFVKKSKSSRWDTVITEIKTGVYRKSIRGLWNGAKGSRRQFLKFISRTIRQEISTLLRHDTEFPLCSDVNMANIEKFPWDTTLSLAKTHAPLLSTVLLSSVSLPSNEESLQTKQGLNLKPIVGNAMACLHRGRSYKKATFIPTLNSVQFWREGLKRDTVKQMSKAGICMSYEATLSAVDSLTKGFDTASLTCKSSLESDLSLPSTVQRDNVDLEQSIAIAETQDNIDNEVNEPSSDEEGSRTAQLSSGDHHNSTDTSEVDDDESDYSGTDSSSSTDDVEDTDQGDTTVDSDEDDSEEKHPGFTLCWDNVGKKVVTRHPTIDKSNTYINMAIGYLAVNRVNTSGLDWSEMETLPKATELADNIFIPNTHDIQGLRDRMVVIVGRIISRHISWFRDHFSEHVTKHVVHDYTIQSSMRSVIINLGVFDENPSSTQGAVGIYERLQRYVPSIDGVSYPTLVYGDGLSCERGNNAQNARCNGTDKWERLEGLEPAAQEFHKEMILLQDYFDTFFKGASMSDRGTLSHLKNVFNYRQVKLDISDNFNYAWELMCLTTEGYICLLALELLKMNDLDSRPADASDGIETGTFDDKQMFLTLFAKILSTKYGIPMI